MVLTIMLMDQREEKSRGEGDGEERKGEGRMERKGGEEEKRRGREVERRRGGREDYLIVTKPNNMICLRWPKCMTLHSNILKN